MNTVTTITWLTFHEARRRRMVLIALVLGLAFVALFGVGFSMVNGELQREAVPAVVQQSVYNFFLMAGLYVVHFLTVMIAIFASVDTISGEIATHTIQAIATKPVRRWHIVLGKWLGFAAMITVYLGLLAGGLLLVVYAMVGYVPPNPLAGVLLLILEALVLVSVSLLVGTLVSTMSNGVTLFLLYGLAFIGSWVEQIGSMFQSDAAVRIGIITSLLMPVEALWRRAAYLMQPAISRDLAMTPFATASVPSGAMDVYAVGYAAVALLAAMVVFSRRDL